MKYSQSDTFKLTSHGYYDIKKKPQSSKDQLNMLNKSINLNALNEIEQKDFNTSTANFPTWCENETVTMELKKDKYNEYEKFIFSIGGEKIEMSGKYFDKNCCYMGLSGHDGLQLLITDVEYF